LRVRRRNFRQVPILTGEQQAGAAFSEADRGEVGSIGGYGGTPRMDTAARNRSLMEFFNGAAGSQQKAADVEPSDLSKAVGSAKSAVSATGKANRLFSTPSVSTPSFAEPGQEFKQEWQNGGAPQSDVFNPNYLPVGGGGAEPNSLSKSDYLTGGRKR
jgi:hypothetical protein